MTSYSFLKESEDNWELYLTIHPITSEKILRTSTTHVPPIKVNLVQSLRMPPNHATVVPVKVEGDLNRLTGTEPGGI